MASSPPPRKPPPKAAPKPPPRAANPPKSPAAPKVAGPARSPQVIATDRKTGKWEKKFTNDANGRKFIDRYKDGRLVDRTVASPRKQPLDQTMNGRYKLDRYVMSPQMTKSHDEAFKRGASDKKFLVAKNHYFYEHWGLKYGDQPTRYHAASTAPPPPAAAKDALVKGGWQGQYLRKKKKKS